MSKSKKLSNLQHVGKSLATVKDEPDSVVGAKSVTAARKATALIEIRKETPALTAFIE